MRGSQRIKDTLHDCISSQEYIIVPKAQNIKSLLNQPRRAFFVIRYLREMLTAINLNHQFFLKANKVKEIRS